MADTVSLPHGEAKIRNLWVVLALLVVTVTLYYFYWYYAINRELSEYGRSRTRVLEISPGLALLAMTIGGFLILPPFVSAFRTVKRVRRAEVLGEIQEQHRISHALGFTLFVLGFIAFPVEVFYLQAHLNRLWRHIREEQEKGFLGMRGAAPRA